MPLNQSLIIYGIELEYTTVEFDKRKTTYHV